MASARIQHVGHPTGVANGDYIELTIGTGHAGATALTVGNKLLIACGCYNNTQIDATHLSQQGGTATLGTFSVGKSQKRSGDNFSIALAWVTVTGAGTCTIRLDVPSNNYYYLYLAEWEGLGPVIYSAGGESSTGTTGSTSAMNSTIHGRAFGAWTNATGTVTITPDGAWTEEYEYEDNSTTLCISVISKVVAPGDSVTPTWTLSGNTSWIAAGVIFAEEPPALFGFGATSSPSPNTGVQSQALNSPYWIPAGSRLYVGFAPWKTAANAAVDPTSAMLSDNVGNAASSYTRLILLDTTEYAGGADPNVPGQAIFESPAIGSNATAPTLTIDIDPGGSDTGYWTTSVLVVKNPDPDDGARIASTSKDYRPTLASPGTVPTIVPFGTGTKTKDHWVAKAFGFNRGHDSEGDISDPTEGGTWTRIVHNEESSQFWSGLGSYLEGTDTSSLTPTMVITRNDSSSITKTRGVLAIINLADGEPVGGNSYTLDAEAGTYALTGAAAALLVGRRVAASGGAYSLTGTAAALKRGYHLGAALGAYSHVGGGAALRANRQLVAASGTYVLTGTAAALRRGYRLVAEAGVYALVGASASLRYSGAPATYTLAAETGNYVLTGTAASLRANRRLVASGGTYALNGAAVSLRARRRLPADGTSFSIVGSAAVLRVGRRLVAAGGLHLLVGADAGLVVGRRLTAAPGVYSLIGSSASLIFGGSTYRMDAEPGTYSLSGTDVTFRVGRVLHAELGSHAHSGGAAILRARRRLAAQPGTHSLVGTAAGLAVGRRMTVEPGIYAYTGTPAALSRTRVLRAAPGQYVLVGGDAALRANLDSTFVPRSQVTGATYEPVTRLRARLEI